MNQEILCRLPSIDELMNVDKVARLVEDHDRDVIVGVARSVVDGVRTAIIERGSVDNAEDLISLESLGSRVIAGVEAKFAPSIRRAINAAGIVLHTGLGRSVIPEKAIEAVNEAIRGYCTLATDIEHGQRISRDTHYSDLLCELTGAEAATVANNNAAATLLVLNSIAAGKEVIVSRGQLVEIGGAFRMPEVMEASGAILREVGTTNKTHLRDYANAINENTGAILRVHMSNYRIVGFFEEPGIREIAELARQHNNLPIIDDVGSGALVDLREYGIESEPMIQDSIRAGVDVVFFSGDKLIGGPQCGIMVGKKWAIQKIKKNPLARALRIGKMEVAALEATLKLFLDRDRLNQQHPTYRMLSLGVEELESRAQAAAGRLGGSVSANVTVVDGSSQVGSGSVPAEMVPTRLLSIRPNTKSADALARALRRWNPPIFARIHQEAVLLDFRTVLEEEDETVINALREILG